MFIFTFSDIIGIVIFGLFFVLIIGNSIIESIKQSKCKHDAGVNETMSCDAICRKCGKNLGFIGNLKK